MKRVSRRQKDRDKARVFNERLGGRRNAARRRVRKNVCHSPLISTHESWKEIKRWIDSKAKSIVTLEDRPNKGLVLHLPEALNFSDHYDVTAVCYSVIRKLTRYRRLPKKAYRLVEVNFDRLSTISTSAALVLTAELSRWDDDLRQTLQPKTTNWKNEIFSQLSDLGFFEIFKNKPKRAMVPESSGDRRFVKYIKGRCGDSEKIVILKDRIIDVVGEKVAKWTFLHSGIDEAITNVSHHAYPPNFDYFRSEQNWYLSGSYNEKTRELKIVFYDQGVSIPGSLPSSGLWERIISFFSALPVADRKRDQTLISAAMQIDRTSTNKSDRGKGLQDFLQFNRRLKNGYLSILSRHGLHKQTISANGETIKSERLQYPVSGTLIIWSVVLGL